MNRVPNSLLVGGSSDGQMIYADNKQHSVIVRGERYLRMPCWMTGNANIFVPPTLDIEAMMKLLIETYFEAKQ